MCSVGGSVDIPNHELPFEEYAPGALGTTFRRDRYVMQWNQRRHTYYQGYSYLASCTTVQYRTPYPSLSLEWRPEGFLHAAMKFSPSFAFALLCGELNRSILRLGGVKHNLFRRAI